MWLTDLVTAVLAIFNGALALAISFVLVVLIAVAVIKLCGGDFNIKVTNTYERDDDGNDRDWTKF